MKDLELYLIKFDLDVSMKLKQYPKNSFVVDKKHRLVFLISQIEFIFLANDGIYKKMYRIKNVFLEIEICEKRIMTLESLLTYSCLNFTSFILAKHQKLAVSTSSNHKALELFKYRKIYEKYWDKVKLNQITKRALFIAKTSYLDCSLILFFENTINHLFYGGYALQVTNIFKIQVRKESNL